MLVDELVATLGLGRPQERFRSVLWGPACLDGESVYLLKPLTYMNCSGEALLEFCRYRPVELKDLLVVYDEVALDTGTVRIRAQGSAGGHNGMKSVIASLGTSVIPRLRIGVGPKPPKIPLADFVLGRFRDDELPYFLHSLEKALEACRLWIERPIADVMSLIN